MNSPEHGSNVNRENCNWKWTPAYTEVKAMAHVTAAKQQRKLKAIKADELLQTTDPTELDADIFEPAPEHWKQFLVLPPHLKKVWIDALRQEINTLLKETTFIQEPKPDDEPIIPVTAKMRVKAQANGKLEKAKVRVCLRGDQQEERADESTWCPIAGHRAKRKICANAVRNRCKALSVGLHWCLLAVTHPTSHLHHAAKGMGRVAP